MKNLMLCACAIILTTGLFAQEKKSEIVISLGSSSSYALSYKFGTTKSLWRFNLLSSNVIVGNSESEERSSFDEEIENDFHDNDSHTIGFSVGREYRKPIANKLEFKYGFDVGLNYSKYSYENNYDNNYIYESKNETYTPTLNGIIGFNYIINENILVGIEVLPSFAYRIGNTENNRSYEDGEITNGESESTYFVFNLDNDTARFSLAYRF